MTRRPYRLLSIACCFVFLSLGLWAQTVQVVDAEGHSTTVTAAQIANLRHVTIDVRDHDTPAQFGGVPLATLLSVAGIQLGDKLRDHD
jgi:hypothetical protein